MGSGTSTPDSDSIGKSFYIQSIIAYLILPNINIIYKFNIILELSN